jgi:folate-dependent phosphoribosylglycinamide formyltransferase PurN
MKRVVFLAVDDEFAGLMQKDLFEAHPDWIVGSVISSSLLHRKSNVSAALFLVRRSGCMYLAQMVKMKVLRKLLRTGPVSTPTSLARQHGIEVYRTRDINDDASLAKLRSWGPDLIISTNFSQYVGKRAREIAKVGAWNLHKSYLPHYRGMAPNFHALLQGATCVGATLHILAKGFDTGDILAQVKVPVQQGDSVYELNRRTADAGGGMLLDFLDRFDPANIAVTPQPAGDWRSYSYPTRAELRAFRSKGYRF